MPVGSCLIELCQRETQAPRAGECWPAFFDSNRKECMEKLKTAPVQIRSGDDTEEYLVQEKDYGDMVVYDIFRKDHYLLTMARDGSILFMNFDAEPEDKELFKLSRLNQFVEKIQSEP
jgi:hypothetical protein